MNIRWSLYLETTNSPTNHGYVKFINDMKKKYLDSIGHKPKGIFTQGVPSFAYTITDQDGFTNFIAREVSNCESI